MRNCGLPSRRKPVARNYPSCTLGVLRADLLPDAQGQVRYGQLFAVQPFGNHLVVQTLTGAQIHTLLEQQLEPPASPSQRTRVLSVSSSFSYRYDLSQPPGAHVTAYRAAWPNH